MATLALSIGSNIDAELNIQAALTELIVEFDNIRCSTTYESRSVGFVSDNFLNLAVLTETERTLQYLSAFIKNLEDNLGRDRGQTKYLGRTMDIDILLYGSESGASIGIELPRPEITENAYVLQPLAELLPVQIHPITGVSYKQLWENYDKSKQQLWPIETTWKLQHTGS